MKNALSSTVTQPSFRCVFRRHVRHAQRLGARVHERACVRHVESDELLGGRVGGEAAVDQVLLLCDGRAHRVARVHPVCAHRHQVVNLENNGVVIGGKYLSCFE